MDQDTISTWESAESQIVECDFPLDHSMMVIDPQTVHTLSAKLNEGSDVGVVRTYMLWQPEGTAFFARPGIILGSVTFGQTFAVKRYFAEPRLVMSLLERGGDKECVCVHGEVPEGGELRSLGLRELAAKGEKKAKGKGKGRSSGNGTGAKGKRGREVEVDEDDGESDDENGG